MSNRTRNKELKIFFNDDEFNKLTDDCNALKLSKSEYIRALVNSNIVNVKSNQEILNSILEIYKLNSKLEKLNTNLENEDINGYELIIKNILDETNTDRFISVVSAKSIRYILAPVAHTFQEVEVRGDAAEHSVLHDNPFVINIINKFLKLSD